MKTIEDIIDWLNENKPEQQYMNQDRYRGFWDDSVDFNECYIQAFIQEEEA